MDNKQVLKWNNSKRNYPKHHFMLPSPSLRQLIIGSSNCGKTCLLLKLLLNESWLDYNSLYIYGNSLHQPEYKLLKEAFEKGYDKTDILKFLLNNKGDIEKFIQEIPRKSHHPKTNFYSYDSSDILPNPKDINSKKKNLFVFDDIMTNKNQDNVGSFYTRGRHNNCSCIYISQNYHKLPRQTIRTNCNSLILFKIPTKDLRHIYEDIVSNDMSWDEFNNFCEEVFNFPYSFIAINKDADVENGRYIQNFNKVFIPNNFLYKNDHLSHK